MSDADPIFSSHDVYGPSGMLLFSFDKERIVPRVPVGELIFVPSHPRSLRQRCRSLYTARVPPLSLLLFDRTHTHILPYLFTPCTPTYVLFKPATWIYILYLLRPKGSGSFVGRIQEQQRGREDGTLPDWLVMH